MHIIVWLRYIFFLIAFQPNDTNIVVWCFLRFYHCFVLMCYNLLFCMPIFLLLMFFYISFQTSDIINRNTFWKSTWDKGYWSVVLWPLRAFFELFFQWGNPHFQTSFLFDSLIQQLSCLVQLSLVHRFYLRRLFSPFRLQLFQLVSQLAVLRLQKAHLSSENKHSKL